MKTKILCLLMVGLLFGMTCFSQSMFRALPKAPNKVQNLRFRSLIIDTLPATGTTFTGFRFTGPSVLYAFPNSSVFTGVGVSYEHDTYQTATSKWYTDWSVAAGGYAGGQFAPASVSGVTAVGLSVSFFNKLLTVGVLYNLTNRNVQAAFGPTVSLNN